MLQGHGLQRLSASLDPCQSVDEFIEVYALWEIRDNLAYHRSRDSNMLFAVWKGHGKIVENGRVCPDGALACCRW